MVEELHQSQERLREFFPERARAVGLVLRDQNQLHKRIEAWQEKQLVHFLGILNISTSNLVRAHDEKMISTLAWITRNLLELSVWIQFCVGSDTNAKRFEQDAVQDMYGWSKAILKMYAGKHSEPHRKLSNKMADLETFAQSKGLPPLTDDFKQVRDAANELGRDDFGPRFKLFSKFAHPTAWVVYSASSLEADEGFRDMFFIDGADLAIDSLSRIRHRILFSFPELQSQDIPNE